MAEHTPGPWKFKNDSGRRLVSADGGSLMGNEQYYPWVPTNEADWHLIAAAPALLGALIDLLDRYETLSGFADEVPAVHSARAAISAALTSPSSQEAK